MRNDPYETSDAVFGVKQSLIVDFSKADKETAEKYGVKEGSKVLKHDFVLVSAKETEKLRDQNALKASFGSTREKGQASGSFASS